jgi:hypothetical protein
MNYRSILPAIVWSTLLACPGYCEPASQVNITDGQGEQYSVGNSIFGHKSAIVKDRFGDAYVRKDGWFGRQDKGASILGNSVQYHKGIFGHSDAEVNTIFGSAQYKKGWFKKQTNVNVSPLASLVSSHLRASAHPAPTTPTEPVPLLPGVTAPYVAPASPLDVK